MASTSVPAAPERSTPSDAASLRGIARQRLLWAYGLGDAGTGMAASLIGFYLFIFYTAAAGLPPWMAGLVLMLARLWDAINDPVVGWLSDKTQSRWGPRLPWIVGSAVPLGVAMALMWWLPPGNQWVKFAVFVAISIVANSLYTCVNLPYSALAAELTTDVSLRTRLNTSRFTGSIIAGLVGIVLGGLLLRDHQNASSYWQVGMLSGLLITASTLLCGWGIAPMARHCQKPEAQSGTTRRLLKRVRQNGRFVRVLGLYLLLWCALQIMQTAALIYLPVVMHVPEGWSNWILLPFQVSTLVGLQVWTSVAHRRGRIQALHWGTWLWIAGCLLAMLLIPLDTAIAPLGSLANGLRLTALLGAILLVGLGASTAYLIPWALLPDAIDADPEKPAGQYSAWMVFTQKICISFALFFFGNLMSFSGYVASRGIVQPNSALVAIRLCMGIIPAVLVVLGLVVMRHWPEKGLHLQHQTPVH
ncbi:MFS transporter [Synechococcus sp. HJ21-Hayes]|uniref:MFS transporter n=1 Tax=unclassified Synechococcus TaxID=2626047 RepID=UPI0020CC4993|nr:MULTISPECIES: MFS transporter [unclassified Synechococcus]MCP9832080.1 MFS transporter [Synechococcus sp. JJ3a-Johnson]MCP9853459.1 MFS transporter [Synechococcus sp. HJ21-Hayes]